jgi:BlaI family transcriptional regulator, penicillinase repressor
MAGARLTKFEMQITETVWTKVEASIREMRDAFPAKKRPGYTTVQKMVFQLEAKKVVRQVGNFHMFAASISRNSTQRKLVDDLLAIFGGHSRPVKPRTLPQPLAGLPAGAGRGAKKRHSSEQIKRSQQSGPNVSISSFLMRQKGNLN